MQYLLVNLCDSEAIFHYRTPDRPKVNSHTQFSRCRIFQFVLLWLRLLKRILRHLDVLYWFPSISFLCKGHEVVAISTQTLLSFKPRGEFQHPIQQRIEHGRSRRGFLLSLCIDASRSLEEGITITKKEKKKRDQLSKWPLGVINLFYSDTYQQKGRSRSIKEVHTAEKAIPIEKKKQYFLTIFVFIQIVLYIHSWLLVRFISSQLFWLASALSK